MKLLKIVNQKNLMPQINLKTKRLLKEALRPKFSRNLSRKFSHNLSLSLVLLLGVAAGATPSSVFTTKIKQIPLSPPTQQVPVDPANLWHLERIGAISFWNKFGQGSPNVKVLVCDTGVESNHPALQSNMLPGMNFVDGSTHTEPTGNPHGTRMAGVIGANGNGSFGVSPIVRIVPGKITNDPKGGTKHAVSAKCIRWGADQGIRVVNLSFSGAIDNQEVITAAQYLHDKGGILVISAGNVWGPRDLLDDPNMIAVGMVNRDDWKTRYDSWGPFLDMTAPGTPIYTTDLGGQFMKDIGSSVSAAVVSGAAALILSAYPDITVDQLHALLFKATKDLGDPGRDERFGVGRLDLSKLLEDGL